jgi:hypothetical protein
MRAEVKPGDVVLMGLDAATEEAANRAASRAKELLAEALGFDVRVVFVTGVSGVYVLSPHSPDPAERSADGGQ